MTNINDKPWEKEPDNLSGSFLGINYHIKRGHPELGHLCGYITIPKGNPYHILDTDHPKLYDIPSHGGITFGEKEENGDFTIGFDCSHFGDLSPGLIKVLGESYNKNLHEDDIYRDINYVEDICKQACWVIAGNTLNGKLNKALYERYSKQ